MILPHVPVTTRYVDYGKVFVPNGALDFSTLAYSDPDVAPYGPQLFNRGLVFPENSPFAAQIGKVSAGLLQFEGGFLFTLVQRRREGELSSDPRTDRPFNQVRFVILTREAIEQAFAARVALYSGLALAARHPEAKVWLKDYTAGSQLLPWSPQLERLDPEAPSRDAIRFVANALVSAAQRVPSRPGGNGHPAADAAVVPQPISVPLPNQDLIEALQLVEAVQYWLMPKLGLLSFALDYISLQNVHLRLFPLPADAPAPLPPERVFVPGPAGDRFIEDYHSAICGLEHEALYDPALAGLLSLDLSTAEAVRLYRVEKQAQPLAGPEAQRLYPQLIKLGERRLQVLRRVPRDEVLALLRDPELPGDLRLDLLQMAFDTDHGLLWLFAPFYLAVPRAARDDEQLRGLLRASLGKSPDSALGLVPPDDQAELFQEVLLARRPPTPPPAGPKRKTGPLPPLPTPSAPVTLATGQPVLEALLSQARTPALAAAFKAAAPRDPALCGEALEVFSAATNLDGLLWLWQSAGQGDLKLYATLLERAVQPAWYAELARVPGTWRDLLIEGRALVTDPAKPESAQVGSLLHALPRDLVPFVWQASRHAAAHDAAFGEWWLFNEALALPEQLPDLWRALEQLPAGALLGAGPALNFLLGRTKGLSLLRACTPPGYEAPNEALFATVLTAWQAVGFKTLAGELALAPEDLRILLQHLPGSNAVLAAVALSPVQAPAVHGLSAGEALHWARSAAGPLREPYRQGRRDALFDLLSELPAMDEALLWHLLVVDDGAAASFRPWPQYLALLERTAVQLEALGVAESLRLSAYLDTARSLQSPKVVEIFQQSHIDYRAVLALLAECDVAASDRAVDELLPLAVFHLQETSPQLRERAARLIHAALERTDIAVRMADLPDNVLEYLRANFTEGHPLRAAAGHWIEAELSRRTNAYKLEALLKPAASRASPRVIENPVTLAEAAVSAPSAAPAVIPGRTPRPAKRRPSAAPPPPPSPPSPVDGEAPTAAVEPDMAALLGELALPTSAPKKPDSAAWLWVTIIVLAVLMCAVLAAAFVWVQSLQG